MIGTLQRPSWRVKEDGGGLRSRTPDLAVPLVFKTLSPPAQRNPSSGGRAVDRTRAALRVAGYGLASRRTTALPPFRGEDDDRRLLNCMSVFLKRLFAEQDIALSYP